MCYHERLCEIIRPGPSLKGSIFFLLGLPSPEIEGIVWFWDNLLLTQCQMTYTLMDAFPMSLREV